MAVQVLSQEVSTFPMPQSVGIRDLSGASVEVLADASLQIGTAQLEVYPPEAFVANLVRGHLKIRSANGHSGGQVSLKVNPSGVSLSEYTLHTTDGNVDMKGTELLPLRVGRASLYTTGAGKVTAEYVDALATLSLRHDSDVSHIHRSFGVVASSVAVRVERLS